ncbi:MAG: M20/M25/M40 family metallo-hydrolase, partial [Gemmatimonadaceae bacterium]
MEDTRRLFAAMRDARERLAARDAELLALQLALAAIPAPTGEESERAAFIAERLVRVLPNVRTDAAGNVVAGVAGRGEHAAPVVVCAHLDSVFPRETALGAQHDGTRIIAPGIGDNARGLAALVALAEELARSEHRLERPLVFAATTGEEGAGDLRGARHLFSQLAGQVHAAIALDGAGDTRVVIEALGARRLRAYLQGPGGHSWSAFGVSNPIHVAATITVDLASLPLPREPRVTVGVNRVGGGASINSIPEGAWLEVEVRSAHAAELERWERAVEARMRHAVERANAMRSPGSGALSLTSERIGERPPGTTDPAHPLVLAALEATRL